MVAVKPPQGFLAQMYDDDQGDNFAGIQDQAEKQQLSRGPKSIEERSVLLKRVAKLLRDHQQAQQQNSQEFSPPLETQQV